LGTLKLLKLVLDRFFFRHDLSCLANCLYWVFKILHLLPRMLKRDELRFIFYIWYFCCSHLLKCWGFLAVSAVYCTTTSVTDPRQLCIIERRLFLYPLLFLPFLQCWGTWATLPALTAGCLLLMFYFILVALLPLFKDI
jgi:hypothetical protein